MHKWKRILLKRLKKFSLFDLAVLGAVAIVASGLYFVLFRTSSTLTVTVLVNQEHIQSDAWRGTPQWYSVMLRPGMKEVSGLNSVNAELLRIYSYDLFPPKKNMYLTVRLKTVYNRSSGLHNYKGKPLLTGQLIHLYLNNFLVDGVITHVEGQQDVSTRKKIRLVAAARQDNFVYQGTSGIWPQVADAIKVGDVIHDDQGNEIMRVVDKQETDAQQVVLTADGRAVLTTNPLRKDVTLELDVNALTFQDRYYLFDELPIAIGIGVPFNTDTVSVFLEPISITPVK